MIYKVGSKGEEVGKIQRFLGIKDDEDYGPKTKEAVRQFQIKNKLKPEDGIVGPITWNAMFGEKIPEITKVIYQSQLTSMFGTPRDPAPYLVVFSLEEFKPHFGAVKDFTGKLWSFRIYGHKLMEAPLKQAFKNLVDRGYAKELKTFDGCTNVRPKTGGSGWSVHAWGLAVDLNAAENGYGKKPKLSSGFIKCFTDAGFTAGANWSTPDGMHFQFPRI